MASTAPTTPSNAAPAKMLSQKSLNKLNSSLEKLRSDSATLKEVLTRERSALRTLKAQHDSEIRKLRSEAKKKEEALEAQLRSKKLVKATENGSVKSKSSSAGDSVNATELTRLNAQIDTLKSANKNLQDKLKTAQEADRARASELRAQHTRHAAHARAVARDARANTLQLLEELKTKERIICQLRREASSGAESKGTAAADEKAMEAARCRALELQIARLEAELKTRDELIQTLRTEKAQANSDAEKTETKHRTETFLRDTISDADSAISSAPCSLSPQPSNELWPGGCSACRASGARADAAARESARLTDALRDARDQLELLEFRVLELEDCAAEKCIRENLTDSDSGCVSPGSRIKDSASPEFRRTDSGYKSPTIIPPTSPFSTRRLLHTPVSDAEILSCVDTFIGDSAKSHMVKDHLELMVLNSESAEDRNCLEQILLLLYNLQTFSSSMSDDEHYQVKPKKYCDTVKGRINKLNGDNIVHCKTQKAIATITPYSQQSLDKDRTANCEDSDTKKSLLLDPGAIPAVLQESGIFEGVECESRETQTDFNELHSLSDGSDLNTEIQRLNSIREQLEKKGAARNKSLKGANQKYNDEADTLECKCVKLGKRHKQYYERRLKFLEGKISIYESAQDVKESKLAQRLQKEYNLETKVQDLESQILELNEKVGLLEEECVELDECENDTRLHCQQLEIAYELISAQLRDMVEQRDLSKVQIDKLQCILQELERQTAFLEDENHQIREKVCLIERCIPAIVLWTLYQLAERVTYQFKWTNRASRKTKQILPLEYHPIDEGNKHLNTNFIVCHVQESIRPTLTAEHINPKKCNCDITNKTKELEEKVVELEERLSDSHNNYQREQEQYAQQIERLKEELRATRRSQQNMQSSKCVDGNLLLQLEKELKTRVTELEKREAAYLDMLSQADDMWAEMEAGYKDKILESQEQEIILKEKIQQVEAEKNKWKGYVKPLKQQLRDLEESESSLRYKLEVFQRDSKKVNAQNAALAAKCNFMETELTISQTSLQDVSTKFKAEVDQLRQKVSKLAEELEEQKKYTKECEVCHVSELEKTKKELVKSCRHAMDLDVTNSELREEVESLENQIGLMQQAVSQCKYDCEEKIKALAAELATKSEEVDRLKYQAFEFHPMPSAREELQYRMLLNESCDAKKSKIVIVDKDAKYCLCLSMRMQLMGNLIQDLFDRMHSNADASVSLLCSEIISHEYKNTKLSEKTKANIKNYLLDSILRELKRAINDADLKTKTEMWRETCQIIELSPKPTSVDITPAQRANEAERLASVVCACAAANVYGGVEAMVRSGRNKVKFDMNELQEQFKYFQEEVLTHVNVKMMEEDLVRALENIVNCSSCLSATNSITSLIWSTDV